MADIMSQENPPLTGSLFQNHFVGQSLLIEIVDADGVEPPLPKLRGQVSIHILVEKERQADYPAFPCS
jgi:hypothetical protein